MHRDNPFPDHSYPPKDDPQYYSGNYSDNYHPHHNNQEFYPNHQNYYPNNNNPNFTNGPNDPFNNNYGSDQPFNGRKRGFHHRDHFDRGGCYAKLYVACIPRTVTEDDIRSLFGEHGNIVEIVSIRDKKTGQKQGACFVKYATAEEAQRAIIALHNQYTYPGESDPVKVKFADGEQERLGVLGGKLYVNHLNKQASKKEIEEIFSPYGIIEEIYLLYDELKRSRGCGFIKYSFRDMAEAAINALNGTYIMRDCDLPLAVRYADPRKPRHQQPAAGIMQQGFYPVQQSSSQFSYHTNPLHECPQPSQDAVSEMQKELNPSPWTESNNPQAVGSSSTASMPVVHSTTSSFPVVPSSTETTTSLDCDWSEHTCPDGYKYYYNCETRESRWEKPEVYALFEKKVLRLIQLQNQSNQQLQSSSCLQELGHMNVPSATSMATASVQQI